VGNGPGLTPKEEAIRFLMTHEEALEEGRAPPDPPELLLARLDPTARDWLLRLVDRQRRRLQAPTTPLNGSGDVTLPHVPAADRPLPAVPGYELLGELGRGGMGVVYKARQTGLDRVVALKMILAGSHADHAQLQRFRAEARTVARLHHPNIVQIYEVGEQAGLPFLALEFIEEGSLDKKMAGVPRSPREAAEVVRTLARAVQHAHEQGVVHRDLKPANVLVGQGGVLKIGDFGLAKKVDQTGQTVSGTIIGTPEYMAPEQAAGRVHDVGPWSDVYALGVILYELLTGRPPFRADSLAGTLQQVIGAEPVSPRTFAPRLPRDLETICLKCLEKEPRQRYPGAAGLADDLELFLAHRPIAARPVGFLARAWRWTRRNPVVAALASGVAALVVVALAVSLVAAFQYRARAEEETQARVAQERQLYANRIAVAERELTLNQDVGLASTLLEKCPEHLRGWEWDYLMRLRDGPRPPLAGHDGGLWDAVFSPDGRRIATASIDGTAKVWDAATGRCLLTFTGHALPKLPLAPAPPRVPVTCIAWSPDGRSIATGSLFPNPLDLRRSVGVVKVWDPDTGKVSVTFDKQVGHVDCLTFSPDGRHVASGSVNEDKTFAVWDAHTGEVVHVFGGNASHVHRLRYSPDGRLLLAGCTDGTVKVWDAATFAEVRTFEAHPAPVYDLAFSPDGGRFASAGFDGTVKVWQTATGEEKLTLRGHMGAAMGVAFSPDGRRLATSGYDKTVRLWDAATGEEKLTLRGHTDSVCSVAFSPNGRRLVSASFDREARVWDASPVEERTSPALFTLAGHTDRVNAVAFCPDGTVLASAGYDTTVRLWDGHTGAPVRTLEGHKASIWHLAFSPDGTRLASASWDRTVKVWDVATGRVVLTFTGHATPVHGVCFSPDGRRVASASWDGQLKVWDAATGAETAAPAGHLFPAMAVAWSPDGKRLASASGDRTVKVWEADGGRELLTLRGHDALVHAVAWSPDGDRLASASWDHTARVWDAKTGKEVLTLRGHTDRVQSVEFSRDGTRLATASEDKTVRVWDAEGKEVRPACLHRGVVWSVAFSPDGGRVAAGCWAPGAWVRTWAAEGP
jgi:WD40 repeat protein